MFGFSKYNVFADVKFQVKKKRLNTWRVIQELNPLLKIVEVGTKFTGVSEVLISTELDKLIAYKARYDNAFVVDLIENHDHYKTKKVYATKKKKGYTEKVFSDVDKITIDANSLQNFANTSTDKKHIAIAEQLLRINSVKNYIPLMVSYAQSGRKYYRGSKYTNLQNAPRVVREACFKGTVELDINACSANYLIQQATKLGVNVKSLQQMKSNSFKKKIRYDLAKHVYGVASAENIDKAKDIITAVGLGASLTVQHPLHNKLISKGVITAEQMRTTLHHSFVHDFYTEIKLLHKKMFDANKDELASKAYLHKEGDIKLKLQKGRVCTYLYQKFEADVMHKALKGYEDNIRLSVHDGVYLDNISTNDVNIITKRFNGMDLTISVKYL